MDEQQHRRRRPHRAGDTHRDDELLSAADAHQTQPKTAAQNLTTEDGDHPHRRRRRAAVHHEEESAKGSEATPDDDGDVFWHPESELLDAQQPGKEEKKNPLGALAAVDALVCRIGDFIIEAIRAIGFGLLFAFGAILGGAKKLFRRAGRVLRSTKGPEDTRAKVHTGKRINKEKQAPPVPREVTLEPIRPEEYRGMGDKRAESHKHPFTAHAEKEKRVIRAPKKRVSVLYSAAMAGLVCVALVSLYMVSSILWRSISTRMLNDSLSERYSQLSEGQDEGETDESEQMPDDLPPDFPMITSSPDGSDEIDPMLAFTEEEEEPGEVVQVAATQDAVRSTKFHQVGGDALPEMAALYDENRDLIGWLRMEEILDLPVVYKDNEYYLTRDFYKNKSASGTLFLDENHPFRENAQNLLLHGHNMKDGTMFGRLVQYETNLQFYKNNPFVQYSTLWRKEQYVIFAVLHVSLDMSSPDFFNYFTYHTFSSDAQFDSYVRSLQNRSVYSIPIDVDPSDALLTLSTCLDEDRLVIVARRLREGETKSQLRQLVQLSARQ